RASVNAESALRERLLQLARQLWRHGLHAAVEVLDDLPVRSDQELVEVPRHRSALLSGEPGQVLVERVGLRPLHRDLGEEGEGRLVAELAELLDLRVAPRLLGATRRSRSSASSATRRPSPSSPRSR